MREQGPNRAHVLSVLNLKGGVGKTHAVWLLACGCIERGKRILLLDTDAQGNLSNSFVDASSGLKGIEQLIDPSREPDIRSVIRRTSYDSVDIVPSSFAVSSFDISDQRAWEFADLQRSFVDAIETVRADYDLIVFDCPPRLSLVSFAALVASDGVIVPLEAADWGAQGILQVGEAVAYVRQQQNAALKLVGYLVSRFKGNRTFQRTYEAELRQHFGTLLFDTVLPDLAAFERAVTLRVPITQREPRSRGAAITRAFLSEVLRRIREDGCGGVSQNDQ
ncbi:MAG: ParA family protein [Planctomycetaceae bacterium]